MSEYRVIVLTPTGTRVDEIASFIELGYAKSINAVGQLSMRFGPRSGVDPDLFQEDTRLQVWRRSGSRSYLEMNQEWLVDAVTNAQDRNGRSFNVRAKSALTLAERRFVAFGSAATAVTGAADNLMRQIVRDAFIGSALPNGNLQEYISVPANLSLGPTVTKAAGQRLILQALQDISRDSEQAGTPVYFDFVSRGGNLVFETWVDQPGARRLQGADDPVISLETGSIASAEWGFDLSGTTNVIVAIGESVAGATQIGSASHGSYARTPFSRREGLIDARNAKTTTELNAEASAELQRKRPKKFINAEIANVSSAPYGERWAYGDRVPLVVDGVEYTPMVESVSVSVRNGTEEIRAVLRF